VVKGADDVGHEGCRHEGKEESQEKLIARDRQLERGEGERGDGQPTIGEHGNEEGGGAKARERQLHGRDRQKRRGAGSDLGQIEVAHFSPAFVAYYWGYTGSIFYRNTVKNEGVIIQRTWTCTLLGYS